MEQKLKFFGKDLHLYITNRAMAGLAQSEGVLFIEMELLIDDLARKTVRCNDSPKDNIHYQWLSPKMALAYCPFLTVGPDGKGPDANLIDRPIKRFQNNTPNYLELDYSGDEFFGSFELYYKPKKPKKKLALGGLLKPLHGYKD